MRTDRPLVLGYPRSGFTLLISVIAELIGVNQDTRTRSLKALCDTTGAQIARRIESVFERRGLSQDLIYNENFRQLTGGPKWLAGPDFRMANFRKYIGLRGDGDFTLITSHPREVLEYYEIIHSHVSPATWPVYFNTAAGSRFASMRHPAGTLTSACFSINALASEYIQRFIPAAQDNDVLRQRIALYKLSDLKFFEALLPPFKAYLEEFAAHEQDYYLMRWEDLIDRPADTILGVAQALGCELSAEGAKAVWAKLDHVNLTGAHKHNLRQGHGISEGWKDWITNTHLDILRDHGLESYARRYGYGNFPRLDERRYTPFQKTLGDLLIRGEIFRDYGDEDLFGFAFNKSNIDFSRFGFRQYQWRTHTCIERSSCRNEALVMEISDIAEASCGQFNEAFSIWLDAARQNRFNEDMVDRLSSAMPDLYDDEKGRTEFQKAMIRASSETGVLFAAEPASPVLLGNHGTTNIIHFRGRYYALPQSWGPVDFEQPDLSDIPFLAIENTPAELMTRLKNA